MAVNIVNVLVSQEIASAPILLQKTGAFVSQGGTTLTPGTFALLTAPADLTPIKATPITILTMTWAGNVVTFTTAAHGLPVGGTVYGSITGVTPAGYNVSDVSIDVFDTTTLKYALTTNPGASTVQGLFTLASITELSQMTTTFFAQGLTDAVYVLELGKGSSAQGVTALTAYITSPTKRFYSYLLPRAWDVESTAHDMALAYTGTTAELYFYVTTTIDTFDNWFTLKSVSCWAEAPNHASNEFSAAAGFWNSINEDPNASNLMTPMQYSYVYGVTPYLTLTNPQKVALATAGVNWIDTGAEGQISQTLIKTGAFMDLKPFSYWYTVDWVNEHSHIFLAAAIINGANTPQNPLYYNQAGINALQNVEQSVMDNSIAFGMVLSTPESPVIVNAIPFAVYIVQNPTDYAAGIYKGFSVRFVPQRGFDSITLYLTASNIPT